MSDRDTPAMRAYVSGRLLLRIVVGVECSYACGLVVVATPGSRVSKARPAVQIVLVFRTGESHRLCCVPVLRCEGQARGAGRKIAFQVARGRNRHICRGPRRQRDRQAECVADPLQQRRSGVGLPRHASLDTGFRRYGDGGERAGKRCWWRGRAGAVRSFERRRANGFAKCAYGGELGMRCGCYVAAFITLIPVNQGIGLARIPGILCVHLSRYDTLVPVSLNSVIANVGFWEHSVVCVNTYISDLQEMEAAVRALSTPIAADRIRRKGTPAHPAPESKATSFPILTSDPPAPASTR